MSAADVVDGVYAAYGRHDPVGAAALYAADATHHEVAQGRSVEGRKAISDGLARFFEAFPDARWEEHDRVVAADAVAVTYTLTGTLAAPLGPFEPRGQRLTLRGVHVFHVVDALVRRSEDYWDGAAFARAMNGSASSPR